MELKVWVEGIQRIVCGVNEKTTCQVRSQFTNYKYSYFYQFVTLVIDNWDLFLIGRCVRPGTRNRKDWTIHIN